MNNQQPFLARNKADIEIFTLCFFTESTEFFFYLPTHRKGLQFLTEPSHHISYLKINQRASFLGLHNLFRVHTSSRPNNRLPKQVAPQIPYLCPQKICIYNPPSSVPHKFTRSRKVPEYPRKPHNIPHLPRKEQCCQ